jgi:hypothetical protein
MKLVDSQIMETSARRATRTPTNTQDNARKLRELEKKLFDVEMPVDTKGAISNEDIQIVVEAVIVLAYFNYTEEELTPQHKKKFLPAVQKALPILHKAGIDVKSFDRCVAELFSKGHIKKTANDLDTFLRELLTWEKQLKVTFTMSPLLLELLNATRRVAAGSESAYALLEKKVGMLRNFALTQLFADEFQSDPQANLLPQIAKYVKFFGYTGYSLGFQERKVAAKKNATKYQEYMALRRQANDMASEFMRNWVRQNADSKGLAKYPEFIKALNKHKIVIHGFATGFTGLLDDTGALYTTAGKKINGKPGPGRIEMNTSYNPQEDNTYVFKAFVDGADTTPSYYTIDFKTSRTSNKFENVDALNQSIDGMRKKWLGFIRSGDIEEDQHDRDFLSACCLEIIYQCQARIGGKGNATKDKTGVYRTTYGLSTILMKHVRIASGKATISYEGKAAFKGDKAVKQKHVLDQTMGPAVKKIISALALWKSERKANDPVWMTDRGGSLSAANVNAMFRYVGAPEGVTIHKLRTLKGTMMMQEILSKHPWKRKNAVADSTTEVTNWLKEKALTIGKQLGHHTGEVTTGTTAIQSYCNPKMMLDLYKDADVMPSKQMLALVQGDSNKGVE